MTRINVYARGSHSDELTYQGKSTLIGHFQLESCTDRIHEETYWDGNNQRGIISRLQCGSEELLRTRQGRWVSHYDARREFNGPEYYEFLTDEQARDWLLRTESKEAEQALEKYFGGVEEESGPNLGGRPEVGPIVKVRMPEELTARVDAARGLVSRAQWVREAIELRLSGEVADR